MRRNIKIQVLLLNRGEQNMKKTVLLFLFLFYLVGCLNTEKRNKEDIYIEFKNMTYFVEYGENIDYMSIIAKSNAFVILDGDNINTEIPGKYVVRYLISTEEGEEPFRSVPIVFIVKEEEIRQEINPDKIVYIVSNKSRTWNEMEALFYPEIVYVEGWDIHLEKEGEAKIIYTKISENSDYYDETYQNTWIERNKQIQFVVTFNKDRRIDQIAIVGKKEQSEIIANYSTILINIFANSNTSFNKNEIENKILLLLQGNDSNFLFSNISVTVSQTDENNIIILKFK